MAFTAQVRLYFHTSRPAYFDSLRNGLILGIQLVPFLMYMIFKHSNYQMMHVLITHFIPLAARASTILDITHL